MFGFISTLVLNFTVTIANPTPFGGATPMVQGFTLSPEGPKQFFKPVMGYQEVKQILELNLRGVPASQVPGLTRHLLKLCQIHKFDPAFVMAVISAESSFRAKVVSYAGAVGLMQVMPRTAQYISKRWGVRYRGRRDLFSPHRNLALGVQYLAYLRDKYNGNFERLMAAYNMGPGRVDQLVAQNRFVLKATKPYVEAIREGTLNYRSASQRLARLSLQ